MITVLENSSESKSVTFSPRLDKAQTLAHCMTWHNHRLTEKGDDISDLPFCPTSDKNSNLCWNKATLTTLLWRLTLALPLQSSSSWWSIRFDVANGTDINSHKSAGVNTFLEVVHRLASVWLSRAGRISDGSRKRLKGNQLGYRQLTPDFATGSKSFLV